MWMTDRGLRGRFGRQNHRRWRRFGHLGPHRFDAESRLFGDALMFDERGFETETRRRAADDGILDRRVDQGYLGRRVWIGLKVSLSVTGCSLELQPLVFLPTGELGGEPLRTDVGGRPVGVGEQRTFHPLFFEVGSGHHRGVVQAPCDEAIPLIAHGPVIGIQPANLAAR